MKSVLISIKPNWCELIASGKKTVEVRKTKPKLETPFKVYIYETNWKDNTYWKNHHKGRLGKVIGEFMCDNIGESGWFLTPDHPMWKDAYDEESCLTDREMYEYSKGGTFYLWHISELVIYDKPRELGEFSKYGYGHIVPLKMPFQSWGYVEVSE